MLTTILKKQVHLLFQVRKFLEIVIWLQMD
nr:MAG TPA: hypothetical protein [Caudoviricetes sp.]